MANYVNPKDMANEFFLLFKRTAYECNLRKLQKLIVFTDFVYYIRSKKTERLLSETTVTANTCGLAVNSIMTPPYSIVINYLNSFAVISDEEIDDEIEINLASVYNYEPDAINVELKNLIRYVFCEFGAIHADAVTAISRKTGLWQAARDDGTQVHYITKDLYDTYLPYDNDEELIKYLKDLLKDE